MIHARNIGQAIVNWPKLLLEAFRCTKPGGYIEIAENGGEILCDDGTMKPNNKVKLFFERMIRAVERTGRPGQMVGSEIKQKLEKAGFVDVVVHKLKFPMAPWPKDRKMKQIGEMVSVLDTWPSSAC